MQVKKNFAVALDYTLTIEGDIVVDKSEPGQPLWYLHGTGNLIVGLERALEGMAKGDEKTVTVAPEDGYGVIDDNLVHLVPKSQFAPTTDFQVGDSVYAQSPDGREMEARVKYIDANEVTVDFNHELAGRTLTFAVKVNDLREATKEELDHGHVHGPGAHNH